MNLIKKIIHMPVLMHVLYIAVIVGIIVFTIMGDSGLYQLHSLNKSKKMLRSQINETKQNIELLENEKVRLSNPDYLEAIIRQELGYIREGEVIYQMTP